MEDSVKVFSKISAILDALAEERDATPTELAAKIGEPRSSLYRLLATLERHEYVQAGLRRGSYQLGMHLFTLGSAVRARFNDVRSAAIPAMEQLHEQTRQTVFLMIRRGFEATCIERIDGELVQVMIILVGGGVPLHGGAAARCLLAFEPTSFWDEFIKNGQLRKYTPTTPVTREELYPELESIAERGYALSNEDIIPGIASVGAPIFDHEKRVRAAISLSGPRPSVADGELSNSIACTLAAADDISQRLGAPARNRLDLRGAH